MVNNIPLHKPLLVGIGGAGLTIVSQLETRFNNKTFLAICSDYISLSYSTFQNNILIKVDETEYSLIHITPIAERITQLEKINIEQILNDFNPIIIIAGVGGKTGSYISPAVASLSKSIGKIVIGIFITPFYWQGVERLKISDASLYVFNSILKLSIAYSNELSLRIANPHSGFEENLNLYLIK